MSSYGKTPIDNRENRKRRKQEKWKTDEQNSTFLCIMTEISTA